MEISLGTSAGAGKPKLQLTSYRRLHVDNSKISRGTQAWRRSHGTQFCEIYLQEFDQALTVNIGEKYSLVLSAGEGEKEIFSFFFANNLFLTFYWGIIALQWHVSFCFITK